ncbi:MAG: DUF1636 domain-containing protein [Rhodobacteraceae bacterium]|nr:DUF1636 domain-containing protein [Paracoccaceae bacterium]
MQQFEPVELLVCTRCRHVKEVSDKDTRPGALLYERLAGESMDNVTVIPVKCLSNCDRGCALALRGPGRWTYVYGRFDPNTDVPIVQEGAAQYTATADGLVPWRVRPEHFRKNCIARIPPPAPLFPALESSERWPDLKKPPSPS